MGEFKKDSKQLTLYQYYQEKRFNPVYAGLYTEEDLVEYERKRRRLFEYNLRLPARSFKDASLLEFGPASGENSLVFARWGAKLHMVEPVREFIETLKAYFKMHGLENYVKMITQETFEDFYTDSRYDFVVAEGFIFQVGSPDYWIPALLSFGKKDCYMIFNHSETEGFLIELLQAKCLQALAQSYNGNVVLLAQELYGKKWKSVPHVRKFEAWVNDNLLSPLVKSSNLNTFIDLYGRMVENDMMLWSSWPSVLTHTDISWVKKQYDPKRIIQKTKEAFLRLIPSLIIGTKIGVTDRILDEGYTILDTLHAELDALAVPAQELRAVQIEKLREHHHAVETYFTRCVRDYRATSLCRLWAQIDTCFKALSTQNRAKITALFNTNGPLAMYWGCPNFYSVWHRFT